jgi:hypothetical protein
VLREISLSLPSLPFPPTSSQFAPQSAITGGLLTTTEYSDSSCITPQNTYANIPTTGTCKGFSTVQGGVGGSKAIPVAVFPPPAKTSGASETATAAAAVVGAAAAIVMAARA